MPDEVAIPVKEPARRDRNDEVILEALKTLQNPAKGARQRLKFTVPTLVRLTGLSTNTIRSRSWALKALRDLKMATKRASLERQSEEVAKAAPEISLVEALRGRVKGLLEQNTLLFDEVLTLRELLKKRDEKIAELQGKRLTAI